MINKFISPFTNDPFALVYMAFKNLYPDKYIECMVKWLKEKRDY